MSFLSALVMIFLLALVMSFLSSLPALHCYLPWLAMHASLLHAVVSPDWDFIVLSGPSGDSGLYHLGSDPHNPVHRSFASGYAGPS